MQVEVGSYTGDGSSPRTIVLTGAWQPDAVYVCGKSGGDDSCFASDVMPSGDANKLDNNESSFPSGLIDGFTATGFTVNGTLNTNTHSYAYVAVQGGTDAEVGTYVGDGNDDRTISLANSFTPGYVWTFKEYYNLGASWVVGSGDDSGGLHDGAWTINQIQDAGLGTFEVGSDAQVNYNGHTHYYIAIAEDASTFDAGRYTGDGKDDRTISGTLTPEWAMTKDTDAGEYPRWNDQTVETSAWNFTGYQVADTLQRLVSGGFEVGTNAGANANGDVYAWWAWRTGETGAGEVHWGSASLVGAGSLSAGARRERFGSATLSGTGGLGASGYRHRFGKATLAGLGTLTASGFILGEQVMRYRPFILRGGRLR